MKIKELLEFFNKRPKFGNRNEDDELMIRTSSPSIGPISMVGIDSIFNGFDWESGKTIITPKERLVVKTEKQDLYDMSYDLLHFLWVDAFQRKRKPWYFDRLKRIYERAGSLKVMTEIAEREVARLK